MRGPAVRGGRRLTTHCLGNESNLNCAVSTPSTRNEVIVGRPVSRWKMRLTGK